MYTKGIKEMCVPMKKYIYVYNQPSTHLNINENVKRRREVKN